MNRQGGEAEVREADGQADKWQAAGEPHGAPT